MIDNLRPITFTARQKIYSVVNRFLFLGTFLIGAMGIVFLKSYDVPQSYVTLLPVVCMITYLLFILSFSKYSTSEERAGDSLYYLGLLYTLVSLAHILYQFTYQGTTTEIFVQNFGIALATTILGLALRVVLIHMHPDYSSSEQEARRAYVNALQAFRDELNFTVVDMQTFRRSIMQSTSEATQELSELVKKVLLENVENFSMSLSAILKGLDTAISTHFKSFEEVAVDSGLKLGQMITEFKNRVENSVTEIVNSVEASKEATKQFSKSIRNVVAAAEKLFAKISEIEAPSDILSTKLDGILTTLTEGANENVAINKAAALTNKEVGKGLAETLSVVENLTTRLTALTTAGADLQKLNAAVSETTALLLSFKESVEANSTQLARLPENFKQDLDIIGRLRIDLEREIAKSRQAISTIQSSLTQLVSVVVEKLRNE